VGWTALAMAWAGAAPGHAAAQDVELLGERYGTRPPAGYFEELRRNPDAFRFSLEGDARLEAMQEAMSGRSTDLRSGMLRFEDAVARSLGPRTEPVVGIFRVPMLLGQFSDETGAPLFGRMAVQAEFFDGPNSRGQTVPQFYAEMSRGQLDLRGQATPWVPGTMTRAQVTRGSSALTSSRDEGMAAWIEGLVAALDAQGMDWSAFDHTGDGYVDVLTLMHPDRGAECGGAGGGSRIWSHRWSVSSASQGRLSQGVRTATPGPGPGGFIHVNDYTVQPLLDCSGGAINQIGVVAHELGHGLGLPDLYSTSSHRHTGVGQWDLMATGSWGCQGNTPARPCMMGAWSRAMLGWVTVEEVASPDGLTAWTLPPVNTEGRVLRVNALDGSGHYLLLENRQAVGADSGLIEPGLLVWQIDEAVVQGRWPTNTVNADPNRMGVRIRTASGSRHLESTTGFGLHGTRGDPYPGCIKDSLEDYLSSSVPCRENDAFHAGSLSRAESAAGSPLGLALVDIERVGGAPFDVAFRLSTRWTRVDLEAEEAGVTVAPGPFRVDGVARDPGAGSLLAAPFQALQVEAPGGVSLAEGLRVGFGGWDDGVLLRARTVVAGFADTALVARYAGREARVRWTPETIGTEPGGGSTPDPGTLVTVPASADSWFPLGTEVSFEVRPRTGFRFDGWTGALAGASNPASLLVDGPLDLGARFEMTFGFGNPNPNVRIPAAEQVEVSFVVDDANAPVSWTLTEGTLPEGLGLEPGEGRVRGVSLEAGTFQVTLRARDAIGLEASARITFEVDPPEFDTAELVGPWLATGPGPEGSRRAFLDWNGNRDGFYDLGDLRRYLVTHGMPSAGVLARNASEAEAFLRQVVNLGSMGGSQP
jgi:M6 family metalloprotease-like protein